MKTQNLNRYYRLEKRGKIGRLTSRREWENCMGYISWKRKRIHEMKRMAKNRDRLRRWRHLKRLKTRNRKEHTKRKGLR